MPRNKHKGHGDNPTTGNHFINLAKKRGASVTEGKNFFKVSTRAGSVHIAPGDVKQDSQTIANLKRWFRLLGLMVVLFFCIFPLLSRIGIL